MPLICDSYSAIFTWYFKKGKLLISGSEFEWGQTIVETSTCVATPGLFLYHREIYFYVVVFACCFFCMDFFFHTKPPVTEIRCLL